MPEGSLSIRVRRDEAAVGDLPADVDDLDWADRSAYWQQQATWKPRGPRQKRKVRSPLVLGGHGMRLRIEGGSLFVQNGFTHYPQKREEWRFFPGHPDLPNRIVVVDGDGGLTFDVLEWLSTQQIPLIQINWRGEAITVAGGTGYVADFQKVRAQREAQADEGRRMAICRRLVGEKIARALETLTAAVHDSPAREIALRETEASLQEMRERPPQSVDALHGIEGRVAQIYFRSWRPIALKWKGRKPIPEEWRRIGPRVSPKSGTNRDATHPVNAMLNYGYAVLESQVRIAILAAGRGSIPSSGISMGNIEGSSPWYSILWSRCGRSWIGWCSGWSTCTRFRGGT